MTISQRGADLSSVLGDEISSHGVCFVDLSRDAETAAI